MVVYENLFAGVYKDKKVFVTGHTGFKGSWLMTWLLAMGAKVRGYALPPNTEPSHFGLLGLTSGVFNDVINFSSLKNAIDDFQPDIIFHLAAQPLVRQSYRQPLETFSTNILGTANVLECARSSKSVRAIVNVTTDKVYVNREWLWGYREVDELGGRDPYSASKACVELIHNAYQRSFFESHTLFAATARAGNVVGGGDWAEDRLIPDLVRACVSNTPIEIRNPTSTRPWQHVLDPLSGYLLLGQKLLQQDVTSVGAWNFGPSQHEVLSVHEVAKLFEASWGKPIAIKDHYEQKAMHEARMLQLDCSKAEQVLGWRPIWPCKVAIQKSAAWYHNYFQHQRINTHADLANYVTDARKMGSAWAESL